MSDDIFYEPAPAQREYRVTFLDRQVLRVSAASKEHAIAIACRARHDAGEEHQPTDVERFSTYEDRKAAEFVKVLDEMEGRLVRILPALPLRFYELPA